MLNPDDLTEADVIEMLQYFDLQTISELRNLKLETNPPGWLPQRETREAILESAEDDWKVIQSRIDTAAYSAKVKTNFVTWHKDWHSKRSTSG